MDASEQVEAGVAPIPSVEVGLNLNDVKVGRNSNKSVDICGKAHLLTGAQHFFELPCRY